MNDRGLDRLFLRYRRKGDTAALGEVFDRAAPELLKLSMHLVRDPVEAEDVLQATFLAAIEGAESFDASRPLMPWLTGILARQAGLVRRKARRVIEQDRLTQRESVDPAQAALLREFSEELVLALQELPDNYREVLWLHLADGKRPVEIAQDLNRAPGTVRMQVHRGLDLLRRALPAGYAAGAGILGSTRGLAAIRGDVLATAVTRWRASPASRAAPSTPGSISGAIGGASALMKITIAFLALAALATTAWWRMSQHGAGTAELSRTELATPSTPDAAKPLERSEATDARSALAVNTTEAATGSALASAGPILLRGRVLGCRGNEFGEVRLTLRGVARFALAAELTVHGTPDAEGLFELDLTRVFAAAKPKRPLEELVLEADHPRYAREELHIPLEGPIDRVYSAELRLSPAGLAAGRVLSPENRPAAGTVVALYAIVNGAPLAPPVDRVACAADGTFSLRTRAAGEHVVLALGDGMRPATFAATLAPGLQSELGAIVLDEGAVIEGTAYHLGQPMRAKALVSASATAAQIGYALENARLAWDGKRFERAGRIVETDPEGHFRIGGLAPGPYRLGVTRQAPEGAPESQRKLLTSTAVSSLVEAPASRVEIRTTFAIVHLRLQTPESKEPATSKPARVHFEQQGNSTDFPLEFGASGSVSVEPRLACALRIEAEGFLGQDFAFDAPSPGEESAQTVVLKRDPALARLALVLRGPDDQGNAALSEAAFHFLPQDPGASRNPGFVRHATGENGVFQLEDLPAGAWSVSVFAGGVYEHYRECWCEAKTTVQLSPAGTASAVLALERGGQLELSAVNRLGSFLAAECTLQRLGGEAIDVEFVGRGPKGSIASRRTLSSLGSCDVHPILRVGSYEVTLSAKGYQPTRLLVEIQPGLRTRARGVLEEAR